MLQHLHRQALLALCCMLKLCLLCRHLEARAVRIGSYDDGDVLSQQCYLSNKGADRAAGLSGRPAAYSPQAPANCSQASFQYMLPLTHYSSLGADGPEVSFGPLLYGAMLLRPPSNLQ